MAEPLLRQVRDFCRGQSLFQPGQHVVCAVSGGADSIALLCLLRELEPTLHVSAAHFNHQLRGEESERDERFVRDFCAARAIPLQVGRGDVAAYAACSGRGLEESARILRYDFLNTLEGDRIATAHHADDNAETMLLHLLRGSGLRGLCGIPPRRGRIIRPLLTVTRQELREYLRTRALPWVEDSSNQEDAALRNRLRHGIMPQLDALAPDFARRLSACAGLLREDEACLQAQAMQLLAQARTPDGALRCPVLLEAPVALRSRALRLWLADALPQDLSQTHLRALLELLHHPQPAARCALPGGLTACRRYERLELLRPLPTPDFPAQRVPPDATCVELPTLGLRLYCRLLENSAEIPNSPFHFAIRYDMIQADGFLLRPRAPGDRIATRGGCHSSLKKLLITRQIPRDARARMPVLATDSLVLAVVGLGTNPDALPAPGQRALELTIEKIGECCAAALPVERGVNHHASRH